MADTRLTRDRIEALLRKMATTKIVVVGDAMLDVYLVGEVDRVSPEAPVPVVTVHASRHGLGGAANVAANVAALDVQNARRRPRPADAPDRRGDRRPDLGERHGETRPLAGARPRGCGCV